MVSEGFMPSSVSFFLSSTSIFADTVTVFVKYTTGSLLQSRNIRRHYILVRLMRVWVYSAFIVFSGRARKKMNGLVVGFGV